MKNKKLITFDLWQTLADARLRPSILLDIFTHKPVQQDFFRDLSRSDIFLKDIDTEITLSVFLNKFGIEDKDVIKKAFLLWQKMAASSYLIEGAEALILDLKSKGYSLCLMSNVDKYGYEHFSHTDFLKNFDYTFLSYKEGIGKPDIRCWKNVSVRSGFDFKDILMVGDSLEYDILPAQNLGIESVHIVDRGDFKKVYDSLNKNIYAQA